jgi:hypothetical protein
MKKSLQGCSLRVAVLTVVLAVACGDDSSPPPDMFELLDSSVDASERTDDDGGGVDGDSGFVQHDAAVDGSTDASDANALDGGIDGSMDIPMSKVCGDAIRGVVDEECDDGPGDDDDACTEACRARAVGVLALQNGSLDDAGVSTEPPRSLGTSGHALAATPTGLAAAVVEDDTEARVLVQRFDSAGARIGREIEISAEAAAISVPSPAIAAVPGEGYVVAFTEIGAGSPDVALVSIDGATGAVGARTIANDQVGGPQQEADILWVGGRLVVAWTDLFDIYVRSFDRRLDPLEDEILVAGSDALETSVTLAPHAGDAAVAWRSQRAGLESVHVLAEGVEWWTTPTAGGAGDRPAIVSLDDERLLLVFTAIVNGVRRARSSLLRLDSPGEVADVPLPVLVGPIEGADYEAYGPRAVNVRGRIYIAWETLLPGFEDNHAVDMLELAVSAGGHLEPVGQWELPIEGDITHDRRSPALASSPLIPEGAVITLWEDHSAALASRPTPDVFMSVRPSPIVELP